MFQRAVEKQIKERQFYEYYHPATYGSKAVFDEFCRSYDLKLVWARNSGRVKHYPI